MASAKKIVLVTGANIGLGYETVKAFLQSERPYHVFLGSRSLEKGKRALETMKAEAPEATNTIEILPVDLTSDQSIENACEQVKTSAGRIDVLINNAGATFDLAHGAGKVSLRASFTQAYDANVAGTHVLTWALAPLLLQSADPRLVFVGGLSHLLDAADTTKPYYPTPPQPAGWPKPPVGFETIGYRCSKTAMNMLMLDWHHRLRADGVKVWAVGPGMLDTHLGGDDAPSAEARKHMNLAHPRVGAELLRRVAEGERDADVGKFIGKDGFLKW